jgi:hypothetical protein
VPNDGRLFEEIGSIEKVAYIATQWNIKNLGKVL